MSKGFWNRVRVPLLGTLRADPFDKLISHAKMVNLCTESMKSAIDAYFDGRFEEFEKYRALVSEQEEDADKIKRNIRNHLPSSIHMSVDKRNFLILLTQQDKILDYEEDVVQWLSMREKKYGPEISDEFKKITKKVVETVGYYEKAVFNLPEVLESSFSDEERNETKKYIKKVSKAEYESDMIEHEASKKLFSMEKELTGMDFFHLMRAIHLLGEISNHAENASDRVRTLLAR